ncbi:tRNA (adenosine(37)-N6)-threonylcarbamoyltransferase complex ATPase subunit type 1 TsaE [Planktotalea sp.]|uniref:tRNA (adenosine(37)-N6)-threonylcarbamoyltransferase complex ATPase subunit type 1 TsaE n=1 Tax=Planktotalea sp. TaxID=2029877 RepID=UPI003D6A7250
MSHSCFPRLLNSPDETLVFAQTIAKTLCAGDTLLLQGDIGGGKSFFARALIQSLQDVPEDVPSPTFTLVQTYDTRAGEIWHADLYRLSAPSEADELGLTEAFAAAICLIEWPDRLGALAPEGAQTLTFETTELDDQRRVSLSGEKGELQTRILKVFE